MFPLLGKTCTTPMDIRKAQAFTIRHSGLGLPQYTYGKPTLLAQASWYIVIARSLSEVLIRVAIEQIKMYVHRNARDNVSASRMQKNVFLC